MVGWNFIFMVAKIMAPDVGIHHFNGHDIENLEYE